jgi:chemotaxis signal transduction protein
MTNSTPIARKELLLKQRALRIALPVEKSEAEQHTEWLTFALQNNVYAIESKALLSVASYKNMTPLTLYDELLVGLVNWRGSMLGMINLCCWLPDENNITSLSGDMLVLGNPHKKWGIIVKRIIDLTTISKTTFEQCKLNNKYNDNDNDSVILGRLKSGIWLLNSSVILSRVEKQVEKKDK